MAGNANSGRKQEKPFRDALRMELAAVGDDQKALRLIARKLINMAMEDGKLDAIKEIADRLDGKVPQAVIGGDEDDPAVRVTHVILTALRPNDSGSG